MIRKEFFFNDRFYNRHHDQRMLFFEKKFGKDFFKAKTVLDLGGVGQISNDISEWGAKCTVYEGRKAHVINGRKMFPQVVFENIDFENIDDIPDTKFDIVLNMGIFYHLINPEDFLLKTSTLFNEVQILDGRTRINGDSYVMENIDVLDQSMSGEIKLLSEQEIFEILKDYKIENNNQFIDDMKFSKNYDGRNFGSPFEYTTKVGYVMHNSSRGNTPPFVKRSLFVVKK